jgi:hypothetical protein
MSQNSQNSNNSFTTAPEYTGYQNLSGMEPSNGNQIQEAASSAEASSSSAAPVAPIIVDYNVALASNPNMIKSMYTILKVAGSDIRPEYNENDITVTGGAAYRIYAEQNGLLPKMPTSDIDMVWWTPALVENDVIRSLVPMLCEKIVQVGRIGEVKGNLIRIIQKSHRAPIQTIDFQVRDERPYAPAGIIINSNIHISILINGTDLIENICEISIHNGISSQRFNINHRNLRSNHASSNTKSAQADPIYCDRRAKYTIELFKIRVPIIDIYIIQQLFAYKNLRIQATSDSIRKSHIRLYRVLHFCLINDAVINHEIDKGLERSVRAIFINLQDFGNIKDSYIAEVERDLQSLYGLMVSQPPIFFPITRTTLYIMRQQLQHRKGGFRKKRTIKRKKNKSKTKKRSTR